MSIKNWRIAWYEKPDISRITLLSVVVIETRIGNSFPFRKKKVPQISNYVKSCCDS